MKIKSVLAACFLWGSLPSAALEVLQSCTLVRGVHDLGSQWVCIGDTPATTNMQFTGEREVYESPNYYPYISQKKEALLRKPKKRVYKHSEAVKACKTRAYNYCAPFANQYLANGYNVYEACISRTFKQCGE